MYEPHKHPDLTGPLDFKWMLDTLKKAFWKCTAEKRGNSILDITFTPASPWMGPAQVVSLDLPQSVKGDKGDQGPRGYTGAKGDKGDQGPQGLPGDGICYTGSTSIGKVSANRAFFVGRMNGLISRASVCFILSVFVERMYNGEPVNFQSLTAVVNVTRDGATINPLCYQCNKWVNSSGATSGETINDYWLRGIGATFSNVSGGPYDIFLLGPDENWGLATVNIAWSVHPVFGTAEQSALDSMDYTTINENNDVLYL